MKDIGIKLKTLRERKGLSRKDVCGDESQLSYRQLSRIETESITPTLSSLERLADCMGYSVAELLREAYDLPQRYRDLSYWIQRQLIYQDPTILKELQVSLDDIYGKYYDNLPDSERFMVDCTLAQVDLTLTGDDYSAKKLLATGAKTIVHQPYFVLSDLAYLRLLASYLQKNRLDGRVPPANYELIFDISFAKLLKQRKTFEMSQLFIYSNFLLAGLFYYASCRNYSLFLEGLQVLKSIEQETHDFQKHAFICRVEWKYHLFVEKNPIAATASYQEARQILELLRLDFLIQHFDKNWSEDLLSVKT